MMAGRLGFGWRVLGLASILAGMMIPAVVLAGMPSPIFQLNVPVTSLSFTGIVPLQPGTYTASISNCRIRCTNRRRFTCYISAAPYPMDAQFSDPAEGVNFPIGQLAIQRIADSSYLTFDNISAKQFSSVYIRQTNTWYNFNCNFRLIMTGNEAAGNYSVMIQLTASQSP